MLSDSINMYVLCYIMFLISKHDLVRYLHQNIVLLNSQPTKFTVKANYYFIKKIMEENESKWSTMESHN